MPHLPALANTVKVSLLFDSTAVSVPSENTVYLQDATGALVANLANTADQVWLAWIAHGMSHLADCTKYVGVAVTDVSAIPFAGLDFPKAPVVGSVATGAGALPTSSCLAIKKLTASPGRSGRGRWFAPIWAGAQMTSVDTVSATVANGLAADLAAWQAAVEGGTMPCNMGIVSYYHGGAVRGIPVFEPITAWTYTDQYVDSQRRRLIGK